MSDSAVILIPPHRTGWNSAHKLVAGVAVVLALSCGLVCGVFVHVRNQTVEELNALQQKLAPDRSLFVETSKAMTLYQAIESCAPLITFPEEELTVENNPAADRRQKRLHLIPLSDDAANALSIGASRGARRRGGIPDKVSSGFVLGPMEPGRARRGGDTTRFTVVPDVLYLWNSGQERNLSEPLPEDVTKRISRLLELNQDCLTRLHEVATGQYGSVGQYQLTESHYECLIQLLLTASALDTDEGRAELACQRIADTVALTRLSRCADIAGCLEPSRLFDSRRLGLTAIMRLLNRGDVGDAQLQGLYAVLEPLDDPDLIAREARFAAAGIMEGTKEAEPFLRLDTLRVMNQVMDAVPRGALREAGPAWRALADKYGERLRSCGRSPLDQACERLLAIQTDLRADAANMAAGRLAIALKRYRLATGTWPETMDALAPAYCDAEALKAVKESGGRYEKNEQGVAVSVVTKADIGSDRPFSMALYN